MAEKHISVLLEAVLSNIKDVPNSFFVDSTVGMGWHSKFVLNKFSTLNLLALDQDKNSLKIAEKNILDFIDNKVRELIFINSNFKEIKSVIENNQIKNIFNILFDLGISSYQLDSEEYGFSFKQDWPLDMRLDKNNQLTAEKIVNEYSFAQLKKVFDKYSFDKYSRVIANAILREREKTQLTTTGQLRQVIEDSYPQFSRKRHPAMKFFMALRLEVNQELEILEQSLLDAFEVLEKGWRLLVISFHLLEDKIVKNVFKKLTIGCLCESSVPICVCGNKPKAIFLGKKFLKPTKEEINFNPRSRSAILRVIEKI